MLFSTYYSMWRMYPAFLVPKKVNVCCMYGLISVFKRFMYSRFYSTFYLTKTVTTSPSLLYLTDTRNYHAQTSVENLIVILQIVTWCR